MPRRITDKQRLFLNESAMDMNETRTTRVGCDRHPAVVAAMLLNPDKYPLVAAEVRKVLGRKELGRSAESR
jgi:hypothetical protein